MENKIEQKIQNTKVASAKVTFDHTAQIWGVADSPSKFWLCSAIEQGSTGACSPMPTVHSTSVTAMISAVRENLNHTC